MSILNYSKHHLPNILCILSVIAVTNIIIYTSPSAGMPKGDIIYMNILLVLIALLFFSFGYLRFRSKYYPLYRRLYKQESIDDVLPQDKSLYSDLFRNAIMQKDMECAKSVEAYKSSVEELSDYITKWTHEIKIPISVCELILENGDLSKAETARNVKLELERTRFLINQVLYAGRAACYNEDLSISEFGLDKAVREAVRRSMQSFILKDIEVNLDSLGFTVRNDEKWVSYMLDQILNNAGKYTLKNGKVDIWAWEDERAVRLHIKDNGIGIASHDIKRVFDKGFTGDNGRKTTKSTGMGLYYSKKMADKLGIGIEVSSNQGEYTEITLVFYKLYDYLKVT